MWREKGPDIAGTAGFEAVHWLSVDNSHPPLPIFAYFLGMLPSASNGARVVIWNSPDPVCMCVLNVNHSQTRKSRLTAQAELVSAMVDAETTPKLQKIWDAKLKKLTTIKDSKRRRVGEGAGGRAAAGGEVPRPEPRDDQDSGYAFPGVTSIAFLGGTIERVRERCAGDCSVVRQTKTVMSLPGLSGSDITDCCPDLSALERAMAVQTGMQGRSWLGQGLVYDEVYQFLQDISILDKPSEKRSVDGPGAGQTPMAGWFNRLVQSGRSDHETKSNGSHGGLSCPPVSVSLLGNFHPTPAIEMIRGERGDHGCQAKARLMVVTGMPVQPHELYDEIGNLRHKVLWVPVPSEIHAAMGLSPHCETVHTFRSHYHPEGADGGLVEEGDPWDDEPDCEPFVPDQDGYEHQLPDGVWVRVRMALVDHRYQVEWCIPDRQVDIPGDRRILDRFPHFIKLCAQMPQREIVFTVGARGMFLSYQTFYNVKVKQARDKMDADAGAEFGIAPWKLGQLAACLLMWDILWGTKVYAFREEKWEVEVEHIRRAYSLMSILEAIRQGFRTASVENPHVDVKLAADVQIAGFPEVAGTTTTEIVRRALSKATPLEEPDRYQAHSSVTFRLYTTKEKEKVGKLSVMSFRKIMEKCPAELGAFDIEKDAFIFSIPQDPPAELVDALKKYANTTAAAIRTAVESGGKRGKAKRVPPPSQAAQVHAGAGA